MIHTVFRIELLAETSAAADSAVTHVTHVTLPPAVTAGARRVIALCLPSAAPQQDLMSMDVSSPNSGGSTDAHSLAGIVRSLTQVSCY